MKHTGTFYCFHLKYLHFSIWAVKSEDSYEKKTINLKKENIFLSIYPWMIVFTNNYWYKDCRRGEVQHMNCNFQNMWFEFQKGTYDTKKENPKQLEASVIHLQLFGTSCTLRKNETKKAPRCFSVNTTMMKNSSFLVGHVMWHDRVLSTERKSDDLNSLTAKSLTYGTTSMRAIHHFQSIRTSRFVILQFKVETFMSDQIIMQLQFNFSP